MNLDSLKQLGRMEEEKEIMPGLLVKLHTLASEEQDELYSFAPSNEEIIKNYPKIQRKCLVIATTALTINGEIITKKEDLEKAYAAMQYNLLNKAYGFYLDMGNKQNDTVSELKKN